LAIVRSDADEIQRAMAEIRSQLHQEMRAVVNEATTATDWRSHVRNNPWLAIGIAFTTGFLFVPSRSKAATIVVQPSLSDPQNSRTLVEPSKSRRLPIFGWLLSTLGPIVVRAAQTYAVNHVENLLASQQSGPQPHSAPPAGSPPQSTNSSARRIGIRD